MILLVIVLIAVLCTASAHPSLQRRGLPGAVYTCTEENFRGDCQWSSPTNRCRLPGPAILNSGIKSLGPDPGGFCTLYEKFDCTGQEIQTIQFPGLSAQIPKFGSFRCSTDRDQTAKLSNGNVDSTSSTKTLHPFADPRLAGGVGSMERNNHIDEIGKMERDGFKEGLIGLKKGIYY
ncbi:hypothetical protein IQ07DRAFT_9723 [Pyrenochaeta sp. DS3sAY3a]|nr:hypothetical protein IQ07DRAFT_9723 [Pyrenochaeta sp. DS3sAY3a]